MEFWFKKKHDHFSISSCKKMIKYWEREKLGLIKKTIL